MLLDVDDVDDDLLRQMPSGCCTVVTAACKPSVDSASAAILPQARRRRPCPQEKCPGNSNKTYKGPFLMRCI